LFFCIFVFIWEVCIMKFSKSQDIVGKCLFLNFLLINHKEQAMKYWSSWYRSVLAGIALIAGMGMLSTSALAQFLPSGTVTAGGISANTDITNQATLNYSIGGTGQPAVSSNTTSFKVDNKVNVVVAEVGGSVTNVAPNATGQVTTFTVTNTGNSPMDFALTANGAIANGQTVTLGALLTDSNITPGFDASGCQAFVESGVTAGFQGAQDVNQAIVNLSPVAPGNSKTVYVVCNIPSAATATNGNNALVSLTATTSNVSTCVLPAGTGCVTTAATAGGDNQAAVDIVLADLAGSDDLANDGKSSARDVYQVAAAVISVAKAVNAICDPFNGGLPGNPKSIPGAYVEYAITITNAVGAASATLTNITDALNVNTSFDPDKRTGVGGVAPNKCTSSPAASAVGSGFKFTCAGTARASGVGTCANAAGQFFTTGADGDAMNFTAGAVNVLFGTGGGAVTGAQALPAEVGYLAGELKGGESVTIRFNAIIN
jgi:hypothetical protein